MIRLLRLFWKLFVLASVFGIGYIIGREHSFEEEEDWETDEEAGANGQKKNEGAPSATAETETKIEFLYTDPKATAVSVVGDFNDWNKDKHPMHLDNGTWKASLALKPGRHEYKFVVNNTDWITDPRSSETVADKYGGRSSVVVAP